MTILRRVTATLFVLVMTAASAQASIITLNYDFTASGFEAAGAPVDPVTGSFLIKFDNATDLIAVTSGISLTGLNISLGSAPAFTYSQLDDTLALGGLQWVTGGISTDPPSDDFVLLLWDVSTNPLGRFSLTVRLKVERHFSRPRPSDSLRHRCHRFPNPRH